MFRLRDHVISLVAVFLALGLGIIIGTGISEDMLVKQQRLLIDQMTTDFSSLREERMQLEARLQTVSRDIYLWEKYQEALYPGIVTGVLRERKIAIIYHATTIPQSVLTLIQDGEAKLCSVIGVQDKTALGENTGDLASILTALTVGDEFGDDKEKQLATYLTTGAVNVEIATTEKPDTVLLLVGERGSIDKNIVTTVTQSLQQAQVTVIGLEWSDIKSSLLGDLKAAGISTIDNAETVFGQFSLLSVLRGSAGSYGIKESADELMATF
ncbi:MAG: copper transporter [Firmicutes bacterium]|nr:copper transporter [Bacillota bacterium]